MKQVRHFTFPAVLCASLLIQPIFAQDQPVVFRRSICTKAQRGKGPEVEDLLRKAALKASEYSISQGKLARFTVNRNVYPGGSSAECDYISSFFYNGPPPEANAETQSAAWAAAKVGMTYQEFLTKLNSISHTVHVEIYATRARVGESQVGDYLAVNRMKVNDMAAYVENETKIWKPIQEARVKDGQMRGWASSERVLPSGSGQPYSATTADIFPSWDAMWKQKPIGDYVKRVHPNLSFKEFGEKTSQSRDLVSRELFKMILATGSLPR